MSDTSQKYNRHMRSMVFSFTFIHIPRNACTTVKPYTSIREISPTNWLGFTVLYLFRYFPCITIFQKYMLCLLDIIYLLSFFTHNVWSIWWVSFWEILQYDVEWFEQCGHTCVCRLSGNPSAPATWEGPV